MVRGRDGGARPSTAALAAEAALAEHEQRGGAAVDGRAASGHARSSRAGRGRGALSQMPRRASCEHAVARRQRPNLDALRGLHDLV
jgi:hypothetical protein